MTGRYIDFAENATTVINTNVTLGVLHAVGEVFFFPIMSGRSLATDDTISFSFTAIPVTFNADVFLDYDESQCLITEIRAIARIPTQVGGVPIQPPILDTLLSFSSLPKKRAAIYEA